MKGSRAAAIKAMCKQCIYDPYQRGNWRQQVEACTRNTCPLYEFRHKSHPRDAIVTGAVGEVRVGGCTSQERPA